MGPGRLLAGTTAGCRAIETQDHGRMNAYSRDFREKNVQTVSVRGMVKSEAARASG